MRVYSLIVILCVPAFADYRQVREIDGTVSATAVQRIKDSAYIPKVDGNRDYEEFKAWERTGGRIQEAAPIPAPDPIRLAAKTLLLDRTKTVTQRLNALVDYLEIK